MTDKPFIALIVPMQRDDEGEGGGGGDAHPDHTLPGDLPRPEHPIYFPLPPGAPVHPDHTLPGDLPYPDQGLPGDQPHPDQGLPEPQPHPEHPIVLPPDPEGGWKPVYIWGGPGSLPTAPHPDHDLPIPVPPDPIPSPPEIGIEGELHFKAIWTPDNGWQTIAVIVPAEETPVVTPSRTPERGGRPAPKPQKPQPGRMPSRRR